MEFAYRGSDVLVVVGIRGTYVAGVDFGFVRDKFDNGADDEGGEAMLAELQPRASLGHMRLALMILLLRFSTFW